jgi:hypothetical protein
MAILTFWINVAGMACWIVCFGWMYLISRKQNSLLDQLTEQGKRIEAFSRVEHDLIKEVHPQVSEIKDTVDEVIAVVRESAENASAKERSP